VVEVVDGFSVLVHVLDQVFLACFKPCNTLSDFADLLCAQLLHLFILDSLLFLRIKMFGLKAVASRFAVPVEADCCGALLICGLVAEVPDAAPVAL